jgi:uncharacterized protein (TIGR02246 family)
MAFELLAVRTIMSRAMRPFSLLRRSLGILVLSAFGILSLTADPVGSASTQGKNPDNRKLVTAAMESLVSAWNEKNSDSITRLFLVDAVLVMPSGNVTRSRANIRKRLLSEWEGKLKDSKLSHSIEAISFQGSDAIVKGKYRLDGVTILGFKTEGPFVLRQKQQQGRWMIAKAEILPNNGD